MAALNVSRAFRAVVSKTRRTPVRWKHGGGRDDVTEVFVNATYAARAIDLAAVVEHAKSKWFVDGGGAAVGCFINTITPVQATRDVQPQT